MAILSFFKSRSTKSKKGNQANAAPVAVAPAPIRQWEASRFRATPTHRTRSERPFAVPSDSDDSTDSDSASDSDCGAAQIIKGNQTFNGSVTIGDPNAVFMTSQTPAFMFSPANASHATQIRNPVDIERNGKTETIFLDDAGEKSNGPQMLGPDADLIAKLEKTLRDKGIPPNAYQKLMNVLPIALEKQREFQASHA